MLNPRIDNEWRSEERMQVSLKVNLLNMYCKTRDVSASGVFLEVNTSFAPGGKIDFNIEFKNPVDFTIEFENPGGNLLFICKGNILRVAKRDGKFGVAVKILKSDLKSVDKSYQTNFNTGFFPVVVATPLPPQNVSLAY